MPKTVRNRYFLYLFFTTKNSLLGSYNAKIPLYNYNVKTTRRELFIFNEKSSYHAKHDSCLGVLVGYLLDNPKTKLLVFRTYEVNELLAATD